MGELDRILTNKWPFGPIDADQVDDAIKAGINGADQLFDRSNLIYAQAVDYSRPTYIVGRKGAGKTAFLLNSTLRGGPPAEVLQTATIYHEMSSVLRRYHEVRGQLFVEQTAEIWLALFEQVAVFHACRTASRDDPPEELQVLWDYLGPQATTPASATEMAERYLARLQRRIADLSVVGLHEVLNGQTHNGVSLARARVAMNAVLCGRTKPLFIVMDNLEDLQEHLETLHEVLAGLFAATGRVITRNQDDRPFGLRICLPSELFDRIHAISTAPEKDFRSSYLKIYWTANELLKIAGTRLRLYLRTHHSTRLDRLLARAAEINVANPEIALLRAALPDEVENGFGGKEDPLAYLLRHTQLLPRQLIAILNYVFTMPKHDSVPWAVSPEAVTAGTKAAELIIVQDVITAHHGSFPHADAVLNRLSDKLQIRFPVSELHRVYTREGIRKLTTLEFDDFLAMLFTLGVVGVWFDKTERYNKAHFQYTFDSSLHAQEDTDYLCFHPLFTRHLYKRSLARLRKENTRATYPQGCDTDADDYRLSLGYIGSSRR